MDELLNALWVEKYRPQTLNDLILDPNIKKRLKSFEEDGEIPHLLLVGTSGIGKTTLAKILVNDILDCEYLNINASDEGGIDMVRNEVKSFASSATFDGKPKVIILGEADGLTSAAQNSLKEIIEDYAESTRFIFTANDLSKISDPIVSRCERLDLKCSFTAYKERCADILQKENVTHDDKILEKIIKPLFPDFRKAITRLKQCSVGGVLEEVKTVDSKFPMVLWALLKTGEPEKIREFYINKSTHFSSYVELMMDMAKVAFKNFKPENSRRFLPIINKFIFQDASVKDPELNFYCMILELKENN